MKNIKKFHLSMFYLSIMFLTTGVYASKRIANYEVTITNITPGQTFTPILLASHRSNISIFKLGSPASPELTQLAESGDINPLRAKLISSNRVLDTKTNGELLGPGKSITLKITASVKARYFSLAAMLIPTNDAFLALNRIPFPLIKSEYYAVAYDAGSEPNDELCASIPGPRCQGEGNSPDRDGEGFVHVHNGMHGIGELKANIYDWRNPVAKIVIKRVR